MHNIEVTFLKIGMLYRSYFSIKTNAIRYFKVIFQKKLMLFAIYRSQISKNMNAMHYIKVTLPRSA